MSCDNIEGNEWPGINKEYTAQDMEFIEEALEYARTQHEMIMATLRTGPAPAPTAITSSTPLSAIAQLAPAHLVGSMAIFNRIYIGSIQFNIVERDLEILFGQFGIVKSLNMMHEPLHKRHRGYGFVEFDTPEGAALAQATMDGAELGGRSIKVGRPNNFPSELPPGTPRPLPNRIYVANVHELIGEEELALIFQSFGSLRHCNLVPDEGRPGKHKGYAYVEFEQISPAETAITALHDFELAKRRLKIGRTVVGGPIPAGMPSTPSDTTAGDTTSLADYPAAPDQLQAESQQQPLAALNPIPTVVIIKNMEDYFNLLGEEERKMLEEDVQEECNKFGPVTRCLVHLNPTHQTVSVYVEFDDENSLKEAIKVMHHRWFGGRQIVAHEYDRERFIRNDLD